MTAGASFYVRPLARASPINQLSLSKSEFTYTADMHICLMFVFFFLMPIHMYEYDNSSGVVLLEKVAQELAYPTMTCPITGKPFKARALCFWHVISSKKDAVVSTSSS